MLLGHIAVGRAGRRVTASGHSLIGGFCWALLLAGWWYVRRRDRAAAWLLGAGILSHWVLDVISHRPDMPVLPRGPFPGVGLWNSVAATLTVELTIFVAALVYFVRGGSATSRRSTLWLLTGFLRSEGQSASERK